jgi:type I restriction-modification system DNA methylase subunit
VGKLIDDKKQTIQIKKEILEKHTLKAVMSMPSQLFPGVGTVTAVAVFEAHRPHYRSGKNDTAFIPKSESWFGYWRDDGFMLSKNKRVERRKGLWDEIKKEWLDAYRNQRTVAGKSCKKAVTHTDEWIAEAYMETDYSSMTQESFEQEIKKFALFNLMLDIQGNLCVEGDGG